jgi:hypothetical protein
VVFMAGFGVCALGAWLWRTAPDEMGSRR